MILLALDTSTPRAALAVVSTAGILRTATPDPSAKHGRALVPALQALLAEAGVALKDLDGLVVGLGPGSYTGLRIGLTAAKTLAYALGKPLAGLDSLEIVARNAPAASTRIAVISDAQRGDVYAADFTREAPGATPVMVGPTRIVPLDQWAASLAEGTYVLGPALAIDRLAEGVPAHAKRPDNPDDYWPEPEGLASLSMEVWKTGHRDDPFFLEPRYLRKSAAEDQWDKKK